MEPRVVPIRWPGPNPSRPVLQGLDRPSPERCRSGSASLRLLCLRSCACGRSRGTTAAGSQWASSLAGTMSTVAIFSTCARLAGLKRRTMIPAQIMTTVLSTAAGTLVLHAVQAVA